MTQYWLAVVGNIEHVRNLDRELWWCLPAGAHEGDFVLMYCPRSVNYKLHGIFAQCRVSSPPGATRPLENACGAYGWNQTLLYTELQLMKQFGSPLTTKELKSDPLLRSANVVRRNFQGTTFKIERKVYRKMLGLVNSKREKRRQT